MFFLREIKNKLLIYIEKDLKEKKEQQEISLDKKFYTEY